MNVSFYTLGCKLNYAETSQLQGQFERAGYSVVPFSAPTDVVIINTCTVTENADRECRQIIRRALRLSPNAYVGVTGCYAQLQPEEIASIDGVDAVFGAKEKFSMLRLESDFSKKETPKIFVSELDGDIDFVSAQSSENENRTRANLKIQDGCDYNCSFCTIPLARGASRAMRFEDIPQKFDELICAGYREIVISGINLGDYRSSDGKNFTDVVRAIDAKNQGARVRISSIEPNLLTPEILQTVAQSSVFCPHFHIPLQSGSPEILQKMRRRYKTSAFRDLLFRIKEAIPHCAVGIDVIVGFPGESDELFEETYAFLQEIPCSYLHVFSYSERENTPAAEFGAKVPGNVKKERSQRLRGLSLKKKNEFYQTEIGAVRTVIPETRDAETGLWSGWTETYVRVEFAAEPNILQVPMKIRLLEARGETVLGEVTRENSEQETALPLYIPLLV